MQGAKGLSLFWTGDGLRAGGGGGGGEQPFGERTQTLGFGLKPLQPQEKVRTVQVIPSAFFLSSRTIFGPLLMTKCEIRSSRSFVTQCQTSSGQLTETNLAIEHQCAGKGHWH